MKKVDVDISELLKEARDLTEVANRISTNSPDTDIEIFMQHLASYLADFNYWVSKTSSLTLEDPSLKEQIKKEVSELNKAHTLVIEASKKRKTSLGEKLESSHKKAKAIKLYSTSPREPNLTPKKEG